MPELSVVIPAYNEEHRLPSTLESVHRFLITRGRPFEIVVVNDGSKDNTAGVVEVFASHHECVRLLTYADNQGKGHAVRTGVLAAKGELVLINDADGSSPIEELERLVTAIDAGADVAIGSRAKPDDSRVVKALAYRKYMGNTFNTIVQSLLLPGIMDTQCGFKLFKAGVGREIFSLSRLDGYAFDVEVLYIAKIKGYKIAEVPIHWANVAGSKVNMIVDSLRMLLEVLSIKFAALTGKYNKEANKQRSSDDSLSA